MKYINRAGLDLITRYEELRLNRYTDSAGVPTIGYGHTGDDLPESITVDQAEAYLRADLADACRAVENYVTVPINDNQYAALVSLVFNIGSGAFQGSTLLRHLNAEEYELASEQFEMWRMAGGERSEGLVRRRAAEQQLFRMGPTTSVDVSIHSAEETLALLVADTPPQGAMFVWLLPTVVLMKPTDEVGLSA